MCNWMNFNRNTLVTFKIESTQALVSHPTSSPHASSQISFISPFQSEGKPIITLMFIVIISLLSYIVLKFKVAFLNTIV